MNRKSIQAALTAILMIVLRCRWHPGGRRLLFRNIQNHSM